MTKEGGRPHDHDSSISIIAPQYDGPAMKLYLFYLLRQLALPTLFATLALSGAIWLSQSLRFVDLIVNKGIPATTFIYLTALLYPSLLMVILPFALFCGVLFVYHRLAVESELTVLKAVGLSNLQIAAPCLLLAMVVTGIGYAISLYFMPLAFRDFRDLQLSIERDFSYLMLQPGVFNTPADDLTVYVRAYRPDGGLEGVVVHDERQRRLPVTMLAEEGSLLQGPDGPLFVLERGSRQEFNAKPGENPSLSILHFDRYTLDLAANAAPPGDRSPKPKELYVQELLDPPASLSEARRMGRIAEGHKRLTWPLNALVFALIGLAALLAQGFDRRGPWPSLLIATVGVVLDQSLSMAVGSLAERNLALIPLLYAATIGPALVCLAVIAGYWPRRRTRVTAVQPA
jgi:lipopolysaccharide export system permease protein